MGNLIRSLALVGLFTTTNASAQSGNYPKKAFCVAPHEDGVSAYITKLTIVKSSKDYKEFANATENKIGAIAQCHSEPDSYNYMQSEARRSGIRYVEIAVVGRDLVSKPAQDAEIAARRLTQAVSDNNQKLRNERERSSPATKQRVCVSPTTGATASCAAY
jgi:hypothetical protein